MRKVKGIQQYWLLGEYLIDLAELLENGVSLREGLELLASDKPHGPFEQALHKIAASVTTGGNFTPAVASAFPSLPEFCIEILRQAEKEHDLPNTLLKIGNYVQDIYSFNRKSTFIGNTLFYPLAITLISIIVLTILMIFVIPQFETLFAEFGAELPPITQSVLDVSAYFSDYWWLLASTIPPLFISWRYIFPQFRLTRRLKGKMLLRIPAVNTLYRLTIEAQLTSTLGLLNINKPPPLKFLQAAEQLLAASYARDEITSAKERINTGYSLSDALSDSSLITPRFITILRIFEKRGLKQDLFSRQTERNKRKLNNAPNLSRTLEPVLMIIMGLLVGYLVVAMYLPIFQLGALL